MDQKPRRKVEDLCAEPVFSPVHLKPSASPIYPAAVYQCESIEQADFGLGATSSGQVDGNYIYQRDAHPNADQVSEQIRRLHGCEKGLVCASGMSAIAVAVLANFKPGDHLLISDQLYGRSTKLLADEMPKWGVSCTKVDSCNLSAVKKAIQPNTRMFVVETISNPRLRVSPLDELTELAHQNQARILIDNTFATPVICRPSEFGADLIMESVSKMINGHADLMLGFLGGNSASWDRVPTVCSTWGFASAPFECWLAGRGLMTLAIRMQTASRNAMAAARMLSQHSAVETVDYPGLPSHPDHEVALRLFGGSENQSTIGNEPNDNATEPKFGSVVTFHLKQGRNAAEQFIKSQKIPFFPSLGDICTTLSHPASTSHRGYSPESRAELGIFEGTIRLSVGIESTSQVLEMLQSSLAALDESPKARV
jgi:cystathionine beta-lyase/cystathionine gamma-synthase